MRGASTPGGVRSRRLARVPLFSRLGQRAARTRPCAPIHPNGTSSSFSYAICVIPPVASRLAGTCLGCALTHPARRCKACACPREPSTDINNTKRVSSTLVPTRTQAVLQRYAISVQNTLQGSNIRELAYFYCTIA